jgi:hypothetical protein
VVVSQLPTSATSDPRYGKVVRALHWYGHMRLRDEPGTLKLPGQAMVPDEPRQTTAPPPPEPKGQ